MDEGHENENWDNIEMVEVNEDGTILEEECELTEGSISSEGEGSGTDCVSRLRLFQPVKDIWPTGITVI